MNPMIQFIKQLSGKLNPNVYSTVLNQTDARQVAYLRQLQREIKREDSLEIPFSDLNVIVFDLETTGFYPSKGDKILSIGAVKVNGDHVLEDDVFYSLILSQDAPSKEIEELTGITKDQLEKAPPIEKVLIDFYKYIQGNTLVAHHATHERNFMQHMTWNVLRTQFEHRIVDTTFLTKIIEPSGNLITLDDCCNHFGITINQRHHALHDAIGTAKLWAENIGTIQKLGFSNLKDVYTYLANSR
ncbi:exonuclease domain-containing protein [Evansella sp. AB-P1]|uniref:exonuclease domain-containing protein n=1 Tax=Evansella sp. AB-P1 TaxID=3037653 RepID=UPI0024202DD0|nr:exonuclease domain-containing protein [Evansella sp. AB-P1]MDG5789566.1 exonuclease domain-containing protein [Evansella sp. AB-P1]